MKKFIKNNLFGFILGILISGGVVYATTLIDSKDVTYTPSNNDFNVNNVEGALDELYTLSESFNPFLDIEFQSNVYVANSQLYYLVGAKYIDFDATEASSRTTGSVVGLYVTNDDTVLTDITKSSTDYIKSNWTLLTSTTSKVENISTQGYKYAKALGVNGNIGGGYITVKIHN